MGKTFRRQALDRIHTMGRLDDFNFTMAGRVMTDDQIGQLAEDNEFRKLRKIKKVDRKHGFIETTDGAWKEQKVSKIMGKFYDEGTWTQKGKRYLKWRKRRMIRRQSINDELED